MTSQKELLNLVATEAVEGDFRHPERREPVQPQGPQPKPIQYGLRVVRKADGTVAWQDRPARKRLTAEQAAKLIVKKYGKNLAVMAY